ncbi:MAG: LytTR family transcriptional regulator DNA-binding domain-containing protein [Paludibacter sp.]|nr:LytTR family transcriptional regulator DNA-binding domain-containing protein [Paludibacter sp.]
MNPKTPIEQFNQRVEPEDRRLALHTVTGLLLLKRSEVIYFQYDDSLRSWQIHLTGNRVSKLRTCMVARNILELSLSFFQANQFVIVNIDYLYSIDTNLHCVFHPPYNNLNITISRTYYQKLKETLNFI